MQRSRAKRQPSRSKPPAPDIPPTTLTREQRDEAIAKLDILLGAGCWPIMMVGEDQEGKPMVTSAPPSGSVIRGMVLQLGKLLFPEFFE